MLDQFISKSPAQGPAVQPDEKVLWQSMRKGNDLAFSSLYTKFADSLFNYGMHICYNRDLVLDCIQELFTELWNKRDSLSQVESVTPYLFKSLRNLLVKKIEFDRKRFAPADDQVLSQLSDCSAEDRIIYEDQAHTNTIKISRALEKVSKRQREIVVLKYFNGFSYAQIAGIMGITTASAHNLLSKALQCMKAVIKLVVLLCVGVIG